MHDFLKVSEMCLCYITAGSGVLKGRAWAAPAVLTLQTSHLDAKAFL